MTLKEIAKQIDDKGMTKEEQIRILRKNRMRLLDEIHGKQQLLDQLDDMIHEIKKGLGGIYHENEKIRDT